MPPYQMKCAWLYMKRACAQALYVYQIYVSYLFAMAADNAQKRQQVGEYIIKIEIDRQRCAHVVCFPATDDALHVEQHESGENDDGITDTVSHKAGSFSQILAAGA